MKNQKLEFIRGVAASMVFFCHLAGFFSCLGGIGIIGLLANWGTEAVIVFFILSGIVIQTSQQHNPKTAGQFLLNRFKRLYPIYVLGLLLGFLLFADKDFKSLFGNLFFLGSLQAYIFPAPSYNAVVWSLTFEIFFYSMFCLFILFKYNRLFMLFWIAVSVVCIPLYYLHFTGLTGHLISVFAFSLIWLLGYFISKYISVFPKISLHQVFFVFGLLFLAARIKYTNEFYCVIKYTLFALVTLPIFVYCLQAGNTEKKPLSWIYLIILYALLLAGIFFRSDSLRSSKLIYSVCAVAFLLVSFMLTPAIKQVLLKAGVFLGFISYALYMIHYPLVRFTGTHLGSFNCFAAVALLIPCIIAIAYGLEKASKAIFFSRKKRLKPQDLPLG